MSHGGTGLFSGRFLRVTHDGRVEMPTKHRDQMVAAGFAEPHHGHEDKAVAISDALAAENQAKLDAAAEAQAAADKNREDESAAKRARAAARQQGEISRRRKRRAS